MREQRPIGLWRMKTVGAATVLVLIAVACAVTPGGAEDGMMKSDSPVYSMQDGKLKRPTGWREWVYVGTPVTPNELNNGKAAFPEFHNVYIDPASWKEFKKTGKFRDGTILVKELVSVGSKQAVSGAGYFQGDFIGLEATIKSKSDFPGEPGNWAYFSFTNPEAGGDLEDFASAFPSAACNSCHQAAAADDWVFTQYYPVLRSRSEGK